jgi:ethanolamine utilization cobalamin adenosyltransferase
MSLTPLRGPLELSTQYQDIDPRESMIATLSEQNQILLETMDKAQKVFEENQTKKNQAIENLSETNDELRASLIKAEARNKELMQMHEAEIKTLQEQIQIGFNAIHSDVVSEKKYYIYTSLAGSLQSLLRDFKEYKNNILKTCSTYLLSMQSD